MSTSLTVGGALPAIMPATLTALTEGQELLMQVEDVEIPTEHLFHAGMYSRTIRMPAGAVLIGALIKIPTTVIVQGHAKVFVGEDWQELIGYNVIPGSAGRKQMFMSLSPVELTMTFPTSAKTVEEAEQEFTDEYALLMSRRQPELEKVIVTGE